METEMESDSQTKGRSNLRLQRPRAVAHDGFEMETTNPEL